MLLSCVCRQYCCFVTSRHAQFFLCASRTVLSMFFSSHDAYMYTLTVGMQICFGSSLKASKHGTVICLGVCARWWHRIVCASFGQCCVRVSVSGRVFMLLIMVNQCWHWEPFHFHCVWGCAGIPQNNVHTYHRLFIVCAVLCLYANRPCWCVLLGMWVQPRCPYTHNGCTSLRRESFVSSRVQHYLHRSFWGWEAAAEVRVAKLSGMVEGCSIHDMGHLAEHYDVCPQKELTKAW